MDEIVNLSANAHRKAPHGRSMVAMIYAASSIYMNENCTYSSSGWILVNHTEAVADRRVFTSRRNPVGKRRPKFDDGDGHNRGWRQL